MKYPFLENAGLKSQGDLLKRDCKKITQTALKALLIMKIILMLLKTLFIHLILIIFII